MPFASLRHCSVRRAVKMVERKGCKCYLKKIECNVWKIVFFALENLEKSGNFVVVGGQQPCT